VVPLLLAIHGCTAEPDLDRALLRLGRHGEFEGRLAGSIGLASEPADGSEARRLRRRIREQLARLNAEGEPADRARYQGLISLLEGRLEAAQAGFRSASLRSDDWRSWNDLAVASMERARAEDRPLDLLRAITAARRAAELAPDRLEVRFNLALALSKLHLRLSAIRAWREFLDAASSAGEDLGAEVEVAQGYLRRLERRTRTERFERQAGRLDELETTAALALADELVGEFPDLARVYAERRLTESWSDAVSAGDFAAANRARTLAAAIGAALAAKRGDHLIADLIAAFEACRQELDGGRACAQAGAAFAEGVRAFYAGELERAEARLGQAGGEPRLGLPDPLRRLADFYRAYARFQRKLPGAREDFERQLSPEVERRYPSLAGWIHWRLGVVELSSGRNQVARDHYLRGEELLTVASGYEEAVYANNLLAEAFDLIGDVERAWRCRLDLFRIKAYSGEARPIHGMLTTAVLGLLDQGALEAAGAVVDELVAQDLAIGQPEYLAEAYRTRADHRARLGEWQAALDDLERARPLVAALGASVRREHVSKTLDLAEATARIATDPIGADRLLSDSLGYFETTANALYGLRTVELRARTLERLGDRERALVDWRKAIDLRQEQRAGVEGDSRAVALEAAQTAYDAVLEILIERGRSGDVTEALSVAEEARGRYLLDLLGSAFVERDEREPAEPLTAEEIVAGVPPGTVLVEYAVLPRQAIAWVIDGRRVRMVRMPIANDRISRLVATLWNDLDAGLSQAALRADSVALYDALIAPLALDLGTADRVVFIPDRDLARVPFAALFDRRTSRYLIEAVAVASAPSASLFLRPSATARPHDGPELIVAAPDLTGTPSRRLPDLPGALAEAAALRAIYPTATVLAESEATAGVLIESLRDARMLHFAGHAVANADRVLSSELLLARSDGHDGSVTFADLLAADVLGPPVVVLSACRTADGFTVDREGSLGLAAGFVATGSRAVLSTLWQVEDEVSPALLAGFHRRLVEGLRPSSAWRREVIGRIDDPGSRFETWATFHLFEVAEW